MPELKISPFLAACSGLRHAAVPVWFMRQAGRALPEYREIRGRHSMREVIETPELAVAVTLQPVHRYGVDAAILFSDIVTPLQAIGLPIELKRGVGPVIDPPIRTREQIKAIRPLEPHEDMPYVLDAVKLLAGELEIPLIGFAGAPFTLASYLIEGGPSRTHATAKALMRTDVGLWRELLLKLADVSLASLRAQVESGAAAVQLFDSWAGSLSPADYEHFVLPATRRIFRGLSDLDVPRIHFGVGTGELLGLMADAGADVVGVDWRVSLQVARERVGRAVALQGNLDPTACLAPWGVVAERAQDVLDQSGGHPAYIFNLGHGVLPETDPGVLTDLVSLVHERGVVGG